MLGQFTCEVLGGNKQLRNRCISITVPGEYYVWFSLSCGDVTTVQQFLDLLSRGGDEPSLL